jgi:hypothetical protein
MKKNYIFIITLFITLFIFKLNLLADDYKDIKELFHNRGYTLMKCNIAKNWALVDWKYKKECEGMAILKEEMVLIKGGTFQMGEKVITLEDFYTGKYEVTNKEYCL